MEHTALWMGKGFFHTAKYLISAVLAVVCLYLGLVWAQARYLLSTTDREAYSLCDKHGLIRNTDMLTVATFDDGVEVPPMCPRCYSERLKEAEDGAKKRATYQR